MGGDELIADVFDTPFSLYLVFLKMYGIINLTQYISASFMNLMSCNDL